MKILRKAVMSLAIVAAVPIGAAPAEARDHYRYYSRHHDDDAALAVSAGLVGLAIGAAIASDRSRYYYDDGDYYYRDRYYRPRYRSYYYSYDSYPRYDGRWYRHHERRWHHDDDDDD